MNTLFRSPTRVGEFRRIAYTGTSTSTSTVRVRVRTTSVPIRLGISGIGFQNYEYQIDTGGVRGGREREDSGGRSPPGNGNAGVPTRASTLLGRSSPPFIITRIFIVLYHHHNYIILLPRLGRSSLGINSLVKFTTTLGANRTRSALPPGLTRRQMAPTGA